jgi:hypothetical protein
MATNQSVNIQPRPNVKQINYITKTFTDFRQNLIEFTKSYYPNTYSDFNETSPGMMFIEMAAYVGDVLSFYIDNQFKENLLQYAEQPENIISIAQFLGYKPKLTSPATTTATIYQLVPAVLSGNVWIPDSKYLLKIQAGSTFSTSQTPPIDFRLIEDVDFSTITENEYLINSTDISGNPTVFLAQKQAKLIASSRKTTTFNFGSPTKFTTITLPDENIISIDNVVDSNNNKWYEVEYLAQDVITEDITPVVNDENGQLPSAALRLRKVPRRFVTRIDRNFKTQLVFGSGTDNEGSFDLVLDSRQVANAQYGNIIENNLGNVAVNNINFLDSNAYGIAPANITLTIDYSIGGGVNTNTPSNTINRVTSLTTFNDTSAYTATELNAFTNAVSSVTVINTLPATGGADGEPLDEIKENALAYFNAQNRVVTTEDYVVRTYSMPAKFGRIAKAYAIRDEQINRIQSITDTTYVENPVRPNAINLYTLGYDISGKLTTLNSITKQNLARYLDQYRMLTDDINILDAFIINIGVNFNISVLPNYNLLDVVTRSIGAVQDFFEVSKWNIGQPIIIADLISQINMIEGVRIVRDLQIFNKYQFKDGVGYQNYRYDIDEATVDGVIYTSLDPSIFELKYPQTDIIGNASQ